MNRRNFFKTVTGFVAGVFATVVPKAVGANIPPLHVKEFDKEAQKKLEDIRLKMAMDYLKYPAYVIHEDSSIKKIPYPEFYIPVDKDLYAKWQNISIV